VATLRVIVADDSSLARQLLCGFLSNEPDIEVVAEARNGREALALVEKFKPDLITIDLNMPVMGGLEAIEELMSRHALPILVVSNAANAQSAYQAVQRGALDVVAKPVFNTVDVKEFVDKVRQLARVKVISHMRPGKAVPFGAAASSPLALPPGPAPRPELSQNVFQRIFAIACSTGGPRALAEILPRLPSGFPSPVLIGQHISDGFASGMADWLRGLCKLPVKIATGGELLRPGVIYISPSERNLTVDGNRRVALVERAPTDRYRPSCDVLLSSVAEVFGRQAIGIILTGMGDDGAKGLARIRELGGLTLAQDEASSFIFGMNQVAIKAGAVHKVLSIAGIGDEMRRLAEPASLVFEAEFLSGSRS